MKKVVLLIGGILGSVISVFAAQQERLFVLDESRGDYFICELNYGMAEFRYLSSNDLILKIKETNGFSPYAKYIDNPSYFIFFLESSIFVYTKSTGESLILSSIPKWATRALVYENKLFIIFAQPSCVKIFDLSQNLWLENIFKDDPHRLYLRASSDMFLYVAEKGVYFKVFSEMFLFNTSLFVRTNDNLSLQEKDELSDVFYGGAQK